MISEYMPKSSRKDRKDTYFRRGAVGLVASSHCRVSEGRDLKSCVSDGCAETQKTRTAPTLVPYMWPSFPVAGPRGPLEEGSASLLQLAARCTPQQALPSPSAPPLLEWEMWMATECPTWW